MINKPNILFFFSDQHSPKFIGNKKEKFIDTPTLDKLCANGVSMDNAYCQNALCVPSRASLLTGKYSRNLGIYENRHILESNSITIPETLAKHGYKTCLIGKTHLNGEQFQGYQQRPYGDFYGQGHQPEYIRTGQDSSESGLDDLLDNSGPTKIPLAMTQTEICVSEAVKWLQIQADSSEEQPFFLSVNFDKPHFPYRPPVEYYEKYASKVKLPEYPKNYATEEAVPFVRKAFEINGGFEHYGINREIHERALAAYCGCVEWVDNAIGRIIDALEFLGLSDNTLIVYSTDHGEMAGEKGAWQKTVFFEDSSKVPLIFSMPSRLPQGKVFNSPVGLIDLFPTFCDLAKIETPSQCDGISLLDLLEHSKEPTRKEIFSESVVLKTPEHAGCMIRFENYKYNYYLQGKHELYDIEKDPKELNNLIGAESVREIEKELHDKIVEFWEPEKQLERYKNCPMMSKEKHFYLYSNQFVIDGKIVNARP